MEENFCRSRDRGGGEPNGQFVGKIVDEEREKYTAKNGFLRNSSTESKKTTFVVSKNHASEPITKERLSRTGKARREASRNEFVEKGGMPVKVKSFREINSREVLPRAWP